MRHLYRQLVQAEIKKAPFGERVPFNALTFHAVNERDRGCCQAILPDGSKCRSTKWVEIHHIEAVAHGGTNALDNLTTLCSAHHRIHHKWTDGLNRPPAP